MATTKAIKFAAPYRSRTFNNAHALDIGENGVVTGMSVSTSGLVVTVQPGTFIQNGLLVSSDIPLSATLPTGLIAPYSVVVTTSSSVENPAEVITPTFAQRPEDVTAGSVLVADWDGSEWVARSKLQVKEVINSIQNRSLKEDLFGVAEGLDVTYGAGNVTAQPGSLIDRQGSLFTKTLSTIFPVVAADSDSLGRIDEVLHRRPDDDPNRTLGALQYVVGPTYDPSDVTTILHSTQFGDTSKVNTAGKTLIVPSTNQSLFFFIEDYGTRSALRLRTSPDLMTSVTAAVTIATNLTGFDAVLNPDGSVDIVYSRGNNLFYQRVSAAGVGIFAEFQIAAHTVPVSNPQLVSVTSGATYFLHIVYEVAVSGADHQLFYVRLSSANTIETPKQQLVSLTAVVTNPSLDKDDNDASFFLAYENSTTQRVYLRQYDASTATGGSAPSQIGSTLELQDDTFLISSSLVMAVTGATQPVVKRANNKETYVFWRHFKGSGNYGVAVYNRAYQSQFGHKAVIQDLTAPGENISLFDVGVDGMNNAHFILNVGINTLKQSLKLEPVTLLGTNGTLGTVTPSAVSIVFNAKGSLVHQWSEVSVGATANNSTKTVQFIGPGTFPVLEVIGSNEFVLLESDYLALPIVPTVGDTLTLASAGADNGTYDFLGVRSYTESLTNYVAVATSGTFVSMPSGPTVQFFVESGTNLFFAKTPAGVGSNLRGFSVLHTDIFLAHYRSTDNVVSVSGPILDESTTITRLYEFLNCFAGSGQVSWNIAGANKLAFTSAIKFRFFNRNSLYQVTAIPAGITISNNQVAFIQIPDTDTPATLTLQVSSFGTGILDRHGRNSFPLFWNIDGTLYTRFAPFRLAASGEVINLGASLSQEFMDWVGTPSEVPDPTAHTYSSTSIISDSDSHEAALGKLDAAFSAPTLTVTNLINQNHTMRLIQGGNWSYVNSTGVLAWDATAFIAIPAFADSINTISAGSVTLADGDVAYTTINRSGPGGVIAILNTPTASYTQSADKVILARRVGSAVYLGLNDSIMLLQDGESQPLLENGFVTDVTKTAGETIAARKVVYVSQGAVDGGRTADQIYKVDANNVTSPDNRVIFLGFTTVSVTSGSPGLVVMSGVLTGFSGLSPGLVYYADPATFGDITFVRPFLSGQWVIPVGIALTATSLAVNGSSGSSQKLIPSGSAYPDHFVASESDLSTAITACGIAGGGVICLTAPFPIIASHTVPVGTLLIGRLGATILTAGTGTPFAQSVTFLISNSVVTTASTATINPGMRVSPVVGVIPFGAFVLKILSSTTFLIDVPVIASTTTSATFTPYGALAMSTGARIQDVWGTTANLNGDLLILANNYSIVRGCQFTLPTTSVGSCVFVVGNANKMYNNTFVGVSDGDTGFGITYFTGVDNRDDDSVFLP